MKTPDLKPKSMSLQPEYVNKLLGMDFSLEDIAELLSRMRYGVEFDRSDAGRITVLIPPYRTDILHPVDLVEDIAIAYGYENFKPVMPVIGTSGEKDPLERFSGSVGELMIGFGFQEIMTLIMTGSDDLFGRMRISGGDVVETENPISPEHSVARTWLLPSLMSVLERNKNQQYPQRIFEVGDCITSGGRDNRKIAALIAHSKSNFSEMKAVVMGFLGNLGLKYEFKSHGHNSFIEGRCASTGFGFFGEIHPGVLENFGLEVPVSGFEMDLDMIFNSPSTKK